MSHAIWTIDGPASKQKGTFQRAHIGAEALVSFAFDSVTRRLAIGCGNGFTICTLEDGNVKPLYETSLDCAGISAMAFGRGRSGIVRDGRNGARAVLQGGS